MNKVLTFLFLLTIHCLCFAESEVLLNWNNDNLKWLSYEDGIEEIQKTGKPGLFIIYADWCPTCKQYSKLFSNEKVIKSLEGLVLIRANRDFFPDLSRDYSFDGEYIPRTFALDGNGKVMHNFYQKEKYTYFLPSYDYAFLANFAGLIKEKGFKQKRN